MPTGYTSEIYEGKDVNGKDFIIRCARAFGALIMMRDDPMDAEIPKEFEPNDYNFKCLIEAQQELKKYQTMSSEEIQTEIDNWFDTEVENNKKRYNELINLKLRYEKTLDEVKKWNPPTEDHVALKDFSINQLEESIKFDCGHINTYLKPVVKPTIEEWIETRIEYCERNVTYHSKSNMEEIERTNQRNKWIKDLRESLI